ncbi:beta-scruin-like isoform X2 [Tachypleus tridentatus]|uniref:beta-scruin-like isoform X2 n=1 Tax=Tachypleus tridentatus TaxID=6853 RepID=UPI003FD3413F
MSKLHKLDDPYLGLIESMPYLEARERLSLIRHWKSCTHFSPDMPVVTQLSNDQSPVVLCTGGINPLKPKDYLTGGAMFFYEIMKDKWTYFGTMTEPRNYHAIAYLHGRVYIFGGYNPFDVINGEMQPTATVFQLTIRSKRWRRRADMFHSRACHAAVLVEGRIIIVGGKNESREILSSVEVYEPDFDQWTMVKPMPEPIMGCGAAYLEGLVYVAGGVTNSKTNRNLSIVDHVLCYDPEQNSWYKKPPLLQRRAFCAAITVKREIWICGGLSGLQESGLLHSIDTVEVYSPRKCLWEIKFSLPTPKHAVAIAKTGSYISVLGGINSKEEEVVSENDIYDRERNLLLDGSPLPLAIAGAAAVGIPVNYFAKTGNKWVTQEPDDVVKNHAAVKIQAIFRGHRFRKQLLSGRGYSDRDERESVGRASRSSLSRLRDDRWKRLAPVHIPAWPPNSESDGSSSVYSSASTFISKKSFNNRNPHFVVLPPHLDSNMGLLVPLDERCKKTKKACGLRSVNKFPIYAEKMRPCSEILDNTSPTIVMIGGLNPRDPLNYPVGMSTIRYHILKDQWEYFDQMPEPRNHHASVFLNSSIYVIGGYDPDERKSGEMVPTGTTYVLDVTTKQWEKKRNMICARAHHGVVTIGGRIYVMGGRDSMGRVVSSMEVYTPETDTWEMERPMPIPRMGLGAVTYLGCIWVLGGLTSFPENSDSDLPVLDSVLCYDPVTKIWTSRPPLRTARAYCSAVVAQNTLWVVGGCCVSRSNRNHLESIGFLDMYNTDYNEWENRAELQVPRHSAGVVAFEALIYVIGGMSSKEWGSVSKTELLMLDDETIKKPKEIPVPLTGVSVIAIPPIEAVLRTESLSSVIHRLIDC